MSEFTCISGRPVGDGQVGYSASAQRCPVGGPLRIHESNEPESPKPV
jgi:hypothetical protein